MEEKLGKLQPGALLGDRFEIVGTLGRGAAGSIYEVIDRKRGGETLALKVLRNLEAFDENTLQRFLEEIKVCQEIRHPNVVEAYEYVRLPEGLGFTMELVPGKDLAKIFSERSLSYEEIDSVFSQLCDGISALHSKKIIHRDIKLENILLTSSGGVKLADLGLLKRMGDQKGLTRTGVLLGTAQYMPPEYVKNGEYDERSDLYAVGLALYELISGERRLQHLKGMDALDHLVKTNFVVPPISKSPRGMIPEKYKMILDRTLSPSPRRRYSDAAELKEAFLMPREAYVKRSVQVPGWDDKEAERDKNIVPLTAESDFGKVEASSFSYRRRGPAGLLAALIVSGLAVLIGAAKIWKGGPPELKPGAYEGSVALEGSKDSGLSVSAEVSAGRLFLVLNLPSCRSGFVDLQTGQITCGSAGFKMFGVELTPNGFQAEIDDEKSGARYHLSLDKR